MIAPQTTQAAKTTLAPQTTEAGKTTLTLKTTQAAKTTLAPQNTQTPVTKQTLQTAQAPQTTQAPLTTLAPHTTLAPNTTLAPETTVLHTTQSLATTQDSKASQSPQTTQPPVTTSQVITTTNTVTSQPSQTIEDTTQTLKTTHSFLSTPTLSTTVVHSTSQPQAAQTSSASIVYQDTEASLTSLVPQTTHSLQASQSITAVQASTAEQAYTADEGTSSTQTSSATSRVMVQTSILPSAQSTKSSATITTHNSTDTQTSLNMAETSVMTQASAVTPELQTMVVPSTTGNVNGTRVTDALTTATEYTVVATTPVDNIQALFSLVVEDKMQGSFSNVTCIDAVHHNTNTAVYNMMQDFKRHIGTTYCVNASDVIVELKAGNIIFRGNEARIRIQFSLKAATASRQAVESCAETFGDFLLKELPTMLSLVAKEVALVFCKAASYPAGSTSISQAMWICPENYTFDEVLLTCVRNVTITISSTTASPSTPVPTQAPGPAKTIPRMVLTFKGTFVQETQGSGAEKCEAEYTAGLLELLRDLEPYLQNRDASCAHFYVSITANLTLTRRGSKYDAESQVVLLAVDSSMDRPAMHMCAGFVTSDLQHPIEHLPNVTLPRSYLGKCPPITLSPAELVSNASGISYFCPDCYQYDVFNFQCVDETLPLYTIQIELTVSDVTQSKACQQAIQKAAEDLDQIVVGGTQKLILVGGLCNASSVGARILLQPQSARLLLAEAQTSITIPLVLVSLDGQMGPAQKCENELYSYLTAALDVPLRNMTAGIQKACAHAVGPNNYTITSEGWSCFEGYTYNGQTHHCEKAGISDSLTEAIGDPALIPQRRKREASHSLEPALAYWNSTIPTCQDHEPPTFHGCPKTEQRIEMGGGGPLPVNISIPEVTDNSGRQLFISFQPADFHLPYIFRQNMTVNMSVSDSAGNIAVCRISVVLIDTTPPLVQCPTEVYRQRYFGNSSLIPLMIPPDAVSAWDFSGISHKVFSPSIGSLVPVLQELPIAATVYDVFGNSADCSFVYIVEMDVCPLWTLPEPSGGRRSCSEQLDGLVVKDASCTISCNHSYGFVTASPAQYICVNGSNWKPNNYVPDCALKVFPNQDLNLTLNFTYNGTINNDCVRQIGNSLLSKLEPVFAKICEIIADNITMNITHMGYFDSENQFTLKMKVQLVLNTKALVDAARWCGKQIGTRIENFPVQASASCGTASLQPASDFLVQDTCSSGSILVDGLCLECPRGTNQTGNRCMECPAGFFQDQTGQQTCLPCPVGSYTLTNGAKNPRECFAACEPGYYSNTGLVPCFSCPKGWYQSEERATACQQCMAGYSTDSSPATSQDSCKAKCKPGYYSASGVEPCCACPVGFFAAATGSQFCRECPQNLTTISIGSTSSTQCTERDQCQNQPCSNGATCVSHFRNFQCICPLGYTGARCDEDIDDCASQLCMHGGVCQDHVGYYSCICKPGFLGEVCEHEINECLPNPCKHGQCINVDLGYTCNCYQGYTGPRCEVPIDECWKSPCKHGGTCISRIGGYQCDCLGTGYHGYNCEKNNDDCVASSCLNGATCNDLLGTFSCTCAQGFVGESCEENIDDCISRPCENDGLCVDAVDSFICICKPGYTGQQCEHETDECLSDPCKNGAECTDLLHDYTCSCTEGFQGKNCEENINDCLSSPCNMAGTDWCEDGRNSYKCHCLLHWTGKWCEQLEDPCLLSPCAEGATCSTVGQDFVCTCPADVTGTLCDVRINHCASRPCLNNGSCVEVAHSFKCLCGPGFTGVTCETNVDECSSQPCLNGGTCRDLVNEYTCSCVAGYVGDRCEENVDDCTSQPCQHGATCMDQINNFQCECPKGFEGRNCQLNINECLSEPCKNGGTCVDLVGRFLCLCPPNYSGSICQSGACSLNNTCLNGATCVSSQGKVACLCPPPYASEDCGKEKSGNYDLQFSGSKDSACRPPAFTFPGGSELALCLWLRFATAQGRGTYLTLASVSDNGSNNYTMLAMSGNTLSVSLFGEAEGRYLELSIADGKWHHLCYQWAKSSHALYVDGNMTDTEDYRSQENLPHRMRLLLGQPVSSAHGEPFNGLLSQVSLYNYVLEESTIQTMSSNCTSSWVNGNVYFWPPSDAFLTGNVTVIAPRSCSVIHCLTDADSSSCVGTKGKRDKIAPVVVHCPADQVITNSSALAQVTWQEPVFEDNAGIVRVQQTHRSGQTFQHGEYLVTYIAWDAENNSAECSFEVIIRPFACLEPPAPVNGARICKTWPNGSFCSVTCLPSYALVEQTPPFYSCGRLGFWDPPRGNPFRFPPCSSIHHPSASLTGELAFKGPACSEEFKTELRMKFIKVMLGLDADQAFCKTGACDLENGFRITCSPAGGSRRRREIGDIYSVDINLSITANSNWVAEKVVTAVKQGVFDDGVFTAQPSSTHLAVDLLCLPGQVLHSINTDNTSNICLDCPPGYMFDNSTGDCVICSEGSYTDHPRQFLCVSCPTDTTTAAPGSTSVSDCFAICPAGNYYSLSTRGCELCPRGQYQDTAGQTACLPCPTGHSTQKDGASSMELCIACSAGQELGEDGACWSCPRGTYREGEEDHFCLPCPYGRTTETVGASFVSNCTIVVCEKGWYRLETNVCAPCPHGMYQPSRGSSQCIACGVGLTTADTGAAKQDQCMPGPVNECLTGSHLCHVHAQCVDTETGYNCTCKAGYTGNGFSCVDMCLNYCSEHGVCDYGVRGEPYCNCATGYEGGQCNDMVVKEMNSVLIGGVAGFVVAVLVICVATAFCYWRHRAERKKTQSRIYRTRMSSSAFCNEGYETGRECSNPPSQLMIQEQDSSSSSVSSLSIAPRWNRSTFANSDEDETDACWFESLPMDDMSLGCDAFTKSAQVESQSYF